MPQAVASPTLPFRALHRSPSQRIPDSPSLTNFAGIRSRSASSSMVKRGQLLEYEQHAPQAWHGLVSLVGAVALVMPRFIPIRHVVPADVASDIPSDLLRPFPAQCL